MVQKLKCIYTCYENIDWLLDKTARLFWTALLLFIWLIIWFVDMSPGDLPTLSCDILETTLLHVNY